MSPAGRRHGQAALSARGCAGPVVHGTPAPGGENQVASTVAVIFSHTADGFECPVIWNDFEIKIFQLIISIRPHIYCYL